MSNLLRVTRLPSRGKVPVMMEIQVSPDTAPYLVSSTGSVVWVPEPMRATPELWPTGVPENIVRVAVRNDLLRMHGTFFMEVVDAVQEMGVEAEWGNVHPFTEEGIGKAVEHVESYGLGDLSLLFQSGSEVLPFNDVAMDLGCLPQPCKWLPPNCAVVVPKNREYVGMLGLLGRTGSVGLVHNASRAIGISWRDDSALASGL